MPVVTNLPARITIVECGPRDGLQSEDAVLSIGERVRLVEDLVAAGVRRIEVASFVHPGRVPQMAGAEEIVAALLPAGGDASYLGLVLNERGLERALATRVDEIGFVVAATDGYNTSNQGVTVDATLADLERMIPAARAEGRFASVTVSVAFGCPYDGEVPPQRVADVARRAVEYGAEEIALGDTIGVAVPSRVVKALAVLSDTVPGVPLRCHFHDTRGTALANAYAALSAGVGVLDTSVGGLGGSPFAPGAGGNLATEDLVYTLDRAGIDTGIDLGRLIAVGRRLGARLGHDLPASLQHVDPWP